MSKSGLLKSSGVIGIATAASRVLGFIRDIVFAAYFGTSLEAQAFVVAFKIPNSLRDIVGEGATNAAIVPVLTEYRALQEEREFIRVARVLFNLFFVVLTMITVAGIILSPLIVRLIAPGFTGETELFDLTVRLNRAIFPYLILIGLTAYSMGVLNTLKHFASPAFGPCVMNIALILSMVVLYPRIGIMGLVWGVLIGGLLQLAVTLPAMYRRGITPAPSYGIRHEAVGRIGRLLGPRVLGTAVYQINIFVDTIIASFSWLVGTGGVAALYYANRLIQFPLAIFGLAIAQAALPKLSHEFATNDMDRFKETLSFSLRVVFVIMIPSSIGLAVLGSPIIRILFERGEFTSYSTALTASALVFYALGIFAYAGVKLLAASFYSMKDTMTPVKTAAAAVALNVILSIILAWPLKLAGVALATAISAIFNFCTLFSFLRRRIGDFNTTAILESSGKALIASGAMAAVLAIGLKMDTALKAGGLAAIIASAIIVFIVSGYAINIVEIRRLAQWIFRKR